MKIKLRVVNVYARSQTSNLKVQPTIRSDSSCTGTGRVGLPILSIRLYDIRSCRLSNFLIVCTASAYILLFYPTSIFTISYPIIKFLSHYFIPPSAVHRFTHHTWQCGSLHSLFVFINCLVIPIFIILCSFLFEWFPMPASSSLPLLSFSCFRFSAFC